MIQAASSRTSSTTCDATHEEIVREMEQRISFYAAHPDQISQRLWELDNEWDIDRMLSAGISGLGLLGILLGTVRAKRWFLLPAVLGGLGLQYTLQGWSPIVSVLRQMGVRTRTEVEEERYALKVLRGDFAFDHMEGQGELERIAAILASVLRR